MKKVLFVLAIGSFAACSNGTSTDTKTDSVKTTVDSTRVDSVKVMTDSSARKDTSVKKVDSTIKK